MSSKQKIRWSKSIGGEEQTIYGLMGSVSAWSGMLLDAVCAFLFLLAARMMFDDVFAIGTASITNIISMAVTAILVSVAMELARCCKGATRYGIYASLFLVGIFLCWFSFKFMGDMEDIIDGYKKIGNIYLQHWNKYYGTSYSIATKDMLSSDYYTQVQILQQAAGVLDYTFFCILYFCIWVAKLGRKNMSTMVVPLLIMTAEMLVGYAPKQTAFFLMFVTALLANAHRWGNTAFKRARIRKSSGATTGGSDDVTGPVRRVTSRFTWLILAVCMWLMCLTVALFGKNTAEDVVAGAGDFHKTVNTLIQDIKNGNLLKNFGIMQEAPDESKLTNNPPQYDNVPVLGLKCSDRLYGKVYLKGFQANTYKDGVWTEELQAFRTDAEQSSINPDKVAKELPSFGVNKLCEYYGSDNILETDNGANLHIFYYDKTDGRAYLPYFSQVNSDKITIKGEGLYVKTEKIDSINVNVWQFGGLYEERALFFEAQRERTWERWYNRYITQNYKVVPDEIRPAVNMVIAEIEANDYPHRITSSVISDVNKTRIIDAYEVAHWMQENTQYTLTPSELPEGIDPIVYFLTESREGYCMHYASASVMILRAMGVPARYVTGYVTDGSDFIKKSHQVTNTELDSSMYMNTEYYEITVMDNQAHAWVEIYLENIGWVPIEVTKGYNDIAVDWENNQNSTDTPDEPATDEPTTEEPSTEDATSHEPATEDEPTTEEDSSSGTDESTTGTDGVGDGNSNGALTKILKILIPVILIVSVVGFVAYRIYRNHAIYMARLVADIRKRRTRAVIRKINSSLYKRLRRSGRILKASVTDEEYSRILKKAYPEIEHIDWNRYMNIVKAAAFSTADFTVEEMEFCLKIGEMVKCRRTSEKV